MNEKSATPRDASAVILLNESGEKVLWAQRNPQLAFLGGWHAFPGGKLEKTDALVKVENCGDAELAKFITCAVREAFEETGVLLAKGGEKLTRGQRASLHDDLISGRMTFAEILEHWELHIDATDFSYAGFWTTPQFSPIRFKTRFFIAICPPKQTPHAAISELVNVEFIEPEAALNRWRKSEVLISPPVLLSLQSLAEEFTHSKNSNFKRAAEKLLDDSQTVDGEIFYIELNPRIVCFPLKTRTLPPATHTNCFLVGRQKFIVIDAARGEAEQNELHELIDSFIERGFACQAIVTTHLHEDHWGGETNLQTHLRDKFNLEIPLAAHRETADSLNGIIKFDEIIDDDKTFDLVDENGSEFRLQTIHAPGHARGLLAFYDEEFGFLLSGDNVINSSSVVIAPPEGDMKIYLDSLERIKNLPNLRFLCGSHGSAIFNAREKIETYIAHRFERENQILEAINAGAQSEDEIVERVYIGLKPELVPLAKKSVEAHLIKLRREAKI